MSIVNAIKKNHFEYREKRNRVLNDGYQTYFFFDIHGTILKPNYQYGNISKEFYPFAKEALIYMSGIKDITMIIYTCSHPHEIEQYIQFFAEHGISFKYINDNPEIQTDANGYGCYDKKPYMNVLFEDKAGFDPETEWEMVLNYMKERYGYKIYNKNSN